MQADTTTLAIKRPVRDFVVEFLKEIQIAASWVEGDGASYSSDERDAAKALTALARQTQELINSTPLTDDPDEVAAAEQNLITTLSQASVANGTGPQLVSALTQAGLTDRAEALTAIIEASGVTQLPVLT